MFLFRRLEAYLRVRVRVSARARVTVMVRVGGGGLFPTTSHSIFYSRVGQIATLSHRQPLDWEAT